MAAARDVQMRRHRGTNKAQLSPTNVKSKTWTRSRVHVYVYPTGVARGQERGETPRSEFSHKFQRVRISRRPLLLEISFLRRIYAIDKRPQTLYTHIVPMYPCM